jgi:hypothetical protein
MSWLQNFSAGERTCEMIDPDHQSVCTLVDLHVGVHEDQLNGRQWYGGVYFLKPPHPALAFWGEVTRA